MRIAFRAGLLLALCCLILPALAVPGALRWRESALPLAATVASPDGALLAVERAVGTVELYRSDTLSELREIAMGTSDRSAYVFSPDNTLLAATTGGQTRCYAVATGALLGSYPGTAQAFSAQGALVTSEGTRISFRDPRSGAEQRTLTAAAPVATLALSPRGDVLAYQTDTALVLANNNGETLFQWPAMAAAAHVLVFSPDGSLLAGTPTPERVAVWRVADGSVVRTLTPKGTAITGACFAADNATLFCSNAAPGIHRIPLAAGTESELLPMGAAPKLVALAAAGTRLIAATGSRLAIWDTATNRMLVDLTPSTLMYPPCAFSADGTLLATGVKGGVVLRKAADGALLRTLSCPGGVSELQFSPDGALLALCNLDRILVLRTADWRTQFTLRLPTCPNALAFSADGTLLYAGGSADKQGGQGGLTVWSMRDGALLRTLDTGCDDLWCLAVSPDGRYVACGSQSTHSVSVLDARSGATVRTLNEQMGYLYCVAFTPDGDLVSANQGNELQVIDIASGAVKRRVPERTAPFMLSADGATVLSGGKSTFSPVQVWALASGTGLATLKTHTLLGCLALTRDGTRAATSNLDGLAVWEVQ